MSTSWEDIRAALPAYRQRNLNRRLRVWDIMRKMRKIFPWMDWPILHYIFSFWYSILDEGIYATCKPRWGAITFGWLNDGFKPTIWHTWRQLTHDHTDKYTGIYTMGAPKSLKQAEEWEREWADKRDADTWAKLKMAHDTTHFEYNVGCPLCEERSGEW